MQSKSFFCSNSVPGTVLGGYRAKMDSPSVAACHRSTDSELSSIARSCLSSLVKKTEIQGWLPSEFNFNFINCVLKLRVRPLNQHYPIEV